MGGSGGSGGAGGSGGTISECGDGILAADEECDDGNLDSGDGCSSSCEIEEGYRCPEQGEPCRPICGDGIVIGSEECDDGNSDLGDGCSGICIVEPGWECFEPGEPCVPICGDGFILGSEECDDGNPDSLDGCSESCEIEEGWICEFENTPCLAICGDGLRVGTEECDDGNTEDEDGCSAECVIEEGWECPEPGEPCKGLCGDGLIRGAEECDDGNEEDGDGCSASCTVEDGWECPTEGEPCEKACGGTVIDLALSGSVIPGGYGYEGDSSGNGNNFAPYCQTDNGTDQILSFNVSADSRVTVILTTPGRDAVLAVANACDQEKDSTLSCVDSSTGESEELLLPYVPGGTTLYIVADSFGSSDAGGEYSVEVFVESFILDGGQCNPMEDLCIPGTFCSHESVTCVSPVCGDGRRTSEEECDDGETQSGDGCSATCEREPILVSSLSSGLAELSSGLSLTGTIDPSLSRWDRPAATCNSIEEVGVGLEAHKLENDTSSMAYVDVIGALQVDGYLFVATDPLEFTNPLTSCMFGVMAFTHSNKQVRTLVPIPPGETRWLIVSGASAAEISPSDYELRLTKQDFIEIEEVEPNDSYQQAQTIPDNGILLKGALEAGDADYFVAEVDPSKTYHMQLYSGEIGACSPGLPMGTGMGTTPRRYFKVYAEDPEEGMTLWVNNFVGNPTGCSWLTHWSFASDQVDNKFYFVFEAEDASVVVDPYWLRIDPIAP